MTDTTEAAIALVHKFCVEPHPDSWSLQISFGTMRAILAHIDAQAAEIERLTAALKKANDQAEHFEREWYLRGDAIERLTAERDEHARWRQKLADDLHDRESEISDAWQALRDAGVQSEQSIADGIELMRRQLVEAETDAQRYRWLRGGADIPPHSSRWARWEVRYWCGRHWNTLFAEQIDAAIDALIAQADVALGSER